MHRPPHIVRTSSKACWLLTVLLAVAFTSNAWAQSRENLRVEAEADQAESAGHMDQALQLYAQTLAEKPEWAEGWWKYGGLLYRARRFQEAGQAFGRLVRLAPNNSLGFALLGLCEYEQADWGNAVLHLNKALNRGGLPNDIYGAAAYHLALSLLRERDQSAALLTLKLLFHHAPDYPGLALALGAAELNLEEPPGPSSAAFPATQAAATAAIAVLNGQLPEAEKAYRDLVTEYPDQPYAHLSFGLFLENEHRDDEAAKEFTAETKITTHSAVPWLWLARVAMAQENPERARSYVARAREFDPDEPLAFLIEGRSLMLEHRWQEALVPLQKAEDRAPHSSEVHYALASVYAALHRGTEAEKERQLFLQAQSVAAPGEDEKR